MQKNRIGHRGARIGDMRHRIILHVRSIEVPAYGSVDFSEAFEGTNIWAGIRTANGKIAMDDVGQDVNVTHQLFIRYDETVTSETFIQVEDGRRFRIISVEDYDMRHEYMRLNVTDRGLDEAAKA